MGKLSQANKAFNSKNYVESIDLYLQAIKENPKLESIVSFNLKISEKRAGVSVNASLESSKKNHHLIPVHDLENTIKNDCSHHYVRVSVDQSVSIIVPIYNALEDLKVCVSRLLEYTSPSVEVIFINDASPDAGVQRYLETLGDVNHFRIIKNEFNLGFTKTVNRGIDLAGNNDVVLLNSDARVTPRWLEGIRNALSYDAKIGTVTPMSDRAGAFSAPKIGNENNLPEGVDEVGYAVAFRRYSRGLYPSVPTGNGFCMYIRRACLNEVGALDAEAFPKGYGEENDFCMRASRFGWRHVVDDRTYVFHDRNKSFGEQKTNLIKSGREVIDKRYPEYKKSIRVFTNSPLLIEARKHAALAMAEIESGGIKPRVLFVISTLTGGTPQTNRDLMLALSSKIEPWLLHCDSEVISLYKVMEDREDLLKKQYKLLEPLEPLSHVSHEYDNVISAWLYEKDFEVVHIRHIAWHSLNLAELAKKAGAKVVKSFHDFYAICPTVKLLDENNKFCAGTCTGSSGDCTIDLWKDKNALPQLKHGWVNNWQANFKDKVLSHCDVFVTTHPSVRELISSSLDMRAENFHVIPHGRDFDKVRHLAKEYHQNDVLRILVPGNIGKPKGRDIIRDLVELDKGSRLHFHVLGKCSLKSRPGLTIHGEYARDEFAYYVEKIQPHIGAVLSIWNETWCHTLTELWSVGIPAVVTNYPTLEQRVVESGAGWILAHFDLHDMYQRIVNIADDVDDVKVKVSNAKKYQDKGMKDLSLQIMAEKYAKAYGLES